MAWRDPNDFERAVLEDARTQWPEIIPLARCLALAPRIEPLLLRNARLRFVPEAQAEVESLLWFSPLIAARGAREIVFHLGVAKSLAQECSSAERERHFRFTCLHTRHWGAEDRLERDLRYHALIDDQTGIQQTLRNILRRIRDESEEHRIALARLAKRVLPVIAPRGGACQETMWLAQYAALALGDAGAWVQPGPPQALPSWLAAKLPALPAAIAKAELGLEIRADGRSQVLHIFAADQAVHRIPLPSPLPAQIHVAGTGPGSWHTVAEGARIAIEPPSRHLRLTTLDGRQWDLRMDDWPRGEADAAPLPLWLIHAEADQAQAQAIAGWLKAQGMPVQLQMEALSPGIPADAAPARFMRLWTQAAQRQWAERPLPEAQAIAEGLLLRTDDADLPRLGAGQGTLLDWRDWASLGASPNAGKLLEKLRRWRDGGEIESEPAEKSSGKAPKYGEEIAALLAEIDDPATEPPRRLEIGDLLAAVGDPRPGVGVIEIQAPIKPSPLGRGLGEGNQSVDPKIQRLLDEIANPKTEPPRRLEIGDELDKLGDPRRGVGLDGRGLPDIAWVEIPGGPFIYQDGETRELPAYWISRYPVTNRQFQAFIEAGGYQGGKQGMARQWLDKLAGKHPDWWRDLRKPSPKQSTWPQGNRPRTDVDWHEAVAFTRWLTAVLGLPDGAIRLPTEVEWEKAARGMNGLIYPWGNEYRSGFANIDETWGDAGPWNLQQTTAVGLYPQGRSPYGVEDLSGTVWEWCLNKFGQPEVTKPDTSGDSRGLRGGSWVGIRGLARAGDRRRDNPDDRNYGIGFRVLSSLPIT